MIKLKKRGIIFLSLFVFLISFILAFIYTSLGLRIITVVLEKTVPEIRIDKIDGALYDLELSGFSLEMEGIDVKVDKASLAISGLCLLKGQICVKYFNADTVTVNIDTTKMVSAPSEPTEPESNEKFVLSTPVTFELRSADLKNVQVNVDDMHFGLDSFQGQAVWINNDMTIFPSQLMGAKAIFDDQPAVPVVDNSPSVPIEQQIQTLFDEPLLSSLPEVNIPLNITVVELKGSDWLLHMGDDYYFNNVIIRAKTKNSRIVVDRLETDIKTAIQNAHVKISADATLAGQWPILAKLQVDMQSDDKKNKTSLTSDINGRLLGTVATKTTLTGLNTAQLETKINLVEKYLPVTVKLIGRHIQWPLFGNASYQLNDFALSFVGSAQDYSLTSQGIFQGQELPDVQFDIDGKGSNKHFDITRMIAELPQGKINVDGNVNWSKALKWQTNIQLDGIDLPTQIPNYPIALNGSMMSEGTIIGEAWQVSIPTMMIKGNMKNVPLNAIGSLSASSKDGVKAQQFNLAWGDNNILIDGVMSQDSALVATVDLPTLHLLQPGLLGRLTGDIKLTGEMSSPELTTNLLLKNLNWQGITAKQINLDGQVNYTQQAAGQLEITLSTMDYQDFVVSNASIVLAGNEDKHELNIEINGEPLAGNVKLVGHLDKNRTQWTGNLSDTFLRTPLNDWSLDKQLALSYNVDTQQSKVGAHCWVNGKSSICLTDDVVVSNKGKANIDLKDIDLALFSFLSDGETQLAGTVFGQAAIQWNDTQTFPTVAAKINGDHVYIEQEVVSQSLPVSFDRFTVSIDLNDKEANFQWQFGLKEYGQFSGAIKVTDPVEQKKLSGQIIIDKISLALLNPLLQNDDYADGLLNAHLKLGGSLLDPMITGNLDLEQSDIQASQLPADIHSVMLDIDFHGKSSTLSGNIKTDQGNVVLTGKADWKDIYNWNAELSVKGDGIRIVVPPMLTMTLIPDITIKANQEQIDLGGVVTIPQAKITVESLPDSIVDVSSDEVMLNDQLEEITAQELPMRINSNLRIVIGDRVRLDAFGLVAQLKGDLMVRQDKQGLGLNGQIFIPNGRFHAYGQDLVIQKGELIFAGPVDAPQLNIEAVRNADSIEDGVVAGIRVTGSAESPEVEIFSDPAMSQQSALSYLLRGQGLESGEQSDNDMMTAILIGLGTAQGGKYIGNIGEAFGIKNLSLDTQGVGNDSKVVVSGYVLPNLQVKYGVGIFDSLATFTVRYRLMPRLFLEAVSGLDQSVDLLYQFEF